MMAQQLRVLAALSEGPVSISTQQLTSSPKESNTFSHLQALPTHGSQDTDTGKPPYKSLVMTLG